MGEIAKVSTEIKTSQSIPIIAELRNEDSSDNLLETIKADYRKAKQDALTFAINEI